VSRRTIRPDTVLYAARLEGVPLEGVPLEGVPLEGVPLEELPCGSRPDDEPHAANTNIRITTIDMRFMSSPCIRSRPRSRGYVHEVETSRADTPTVGIRSP
jgi:hypothetical protein